MEKKKKVRIFFRVLKRVLTLKHIVLIIILLSVNTFAWFIFANQVSNKIDVHVRSWKILFSGGSGTITDYADINIDDVYPGMGNYTDEIKAYNMGEVNASVSYKILSARILDTTYYTKEYYEENKQSVPSDAMTSSELETYISNTYPFKITFSVTSENIDAEDGETTYSVKVVWPYESGNDTLDTYWGTQAYNYINNHSSSSCINMYVKIYITQSSE